MLARPEADLAPPLWIGQRFVGRGVQVGERLVGVEHAGAHGEGVPAPVPVAKRRRYGCLQNRGADRLSEVAVDQLDQVADIDRHDHVGVAAGAFRRDALGQALLDKDGVHRHAALGGVGVEERPDQARLAGRIEVHLSTLGLASQSKGNAETYETTEAPQPQHSIPPKHQ